MMRSLYAGVSGLQNHQTRMDVIGNNISNVNTVGFKKGRVNFQDMLSQTMSGAARPTEEVGGVNPKQVGLGMTVASIDTIHTQGSLQTTGVMSDIALQGDGFFILKNGAQSFYTRNGAFGVDENGTLVNPANGLRVQGWTAQVVGDQTIINNASDVGDLVIPIGSKDEPVATSLVEMASNLNKTTPIIGPGASQADILNGTWTVNKDVYDEFGEIHTLQVSYTRVPGTVNQWRATIQVDPQADTDTNTQIEIGDENNANNGFLIQFDNNGVLQSVTDDQGDQIADGFLDVNVSFDVAGATPDPAGVQPRQTLALRIGQVGDVTKSTTQFAATSTNKAVTQNGFGMGYMSGYKIDQSGIITGVFTNGNNRVLGQIALASFTNPGGLEKNGESTYMESNNSGEARVGTSNTEGRGKLIAGALEMSNVDLAEQFTDMIVTQRGFQANSRTIQTSDQMLQELLTLKR